MSIKTDNRIHARPLLPGPCVNEKIVRELEECGVVCTSSPTELRAGILNFRLPPAIESLPLDPESPMVRNAIERMQAIVDRHMDGPRDA